MQNAKQSILPKTLTRLRVGLVLSIEQYWPKATKNSQTSP